MNKYAEKAPLAALDDYQYEEVPSERPGKEATPKNDQGETSFSRNVDDEQRAILYCADDSLNQRSSSTDDDDEDETEAADNSKYASSGIRMYLQKHRMASFSFKYTLFFLNYLFLIAGLAVIVFGIWLLYKRSKLVSDVSDIVLDPAILTCVFGSIIMIITAIGCVGSLRENVFLLKLFHYSMTVIVFVEIVFAVVLVFLYQTQDFRKYLQAIPEDYLKVAVVRYHDDDHLRKWVDLIQTELNCCGFSRDSAGYMGWQLNMYHNCTLTNKSPLRCTVPMSCCILEKGDIVNTMCGYSVLDIQETDVAHRIHTTGCVKAIGAWFKKHNTVIAISTLSIIVPQICSVVFARLLIFYICKQRARWCLLQE